MSNSPYRTTTELPEGIKLSKLEKLFLSGKKWDKFKFHTIVIGKPIAQVVAILLGFAGVLGAIGGIVYLLECGAEALDTYVVSHHYLTHKQFVLGTLGLLVILVLLTMAITKIKEAVKENNARWSRELKTKLNPTPQHIEEDDDSE